MTTFILTLSCGHEAESQLEKVSEFLCVRCPECDVVRHVRCYREKGDDPREWQANLHALVERAWELAGKTKGDAIRLAEYEGAYREFQKALGKLNPEQVLFLLDRSEHLEVVMAKRDRFRRTLAEIAAQPCVLGNAALSKHGGMFCPSHKAQTALAEK